MFKKFSFQKRVSRCLRGLLQFYNVEYISNSFELDAPCRRRHSYSLPKTRVFFLLLTSIPFCNFTINILPSFKKIAKNWIKSEQNDVSLVYCDMTNVSIIFLMEILYRMLIRFKKRNIWKRFERFSILLQYVSLLCRMENLFFMLKTWQFFVMEAAFYS